MSLDLDLDLDPDPEMNYLKTFKKKFLSVFLLIMFFFLIF